MKKSPTIIAYVFIGLTLTRVAEYVDYKFNAGPLAWLFASGLGVAVWLSSYYTRKTQAEEKTPSRNRRYAAYASLILFVLADGFFNLVEVMRNAVPIKGETWQTVGVWIYGLFPTVAAFLMGVLQGYIDREQAAPRKSLSLPALLKSLQAGRWGKSLLVELAGAVMQAGDSPVQAGEQPTATGRKKKQPVSKEPVSDDQLLQVWQQDPYASDGKVSGLVGVSRSAIQQRRSILKSSQKIMESQEGKRRRIDIVEYNVQQKVKA